MWRRRALLVSTVLSLGTVGVGPVHADDSPCAAGSRFCAGARTVDHAVVLGAVDPGATSGVDWGENASRDPGRCAYAPPPEVFDREIHPAVRDGIPLRAIWYVRNCGGSDEYRWYLPGGSVPTDPALEMLIDRAVEQVAPPAPELLTSPPVGSEVLTGFPMYLAVDDGAFSEQSGSVSAGQFTVTAVVRPVQSRFEPGDGGDPLTCEGAGSVWSWGDRPAESDCVHVFTHTPADVFGHGDTFEIAGQVEYEASYTVEGPVLAGTYDLGTLEGPRTTLQVPVIERRAVRTAAG
jgi:hypothetical protein